MGLRESFDFIFKVMSKSPYILLRSGMTSDPFRVLKELFISNPENTAVKLLFNSSTNLFKKFGLSAALYFTMLKKFSERFSLLSISSLTEKDFEEGVSDICTEVYTGSTLEDLRLAFSKDVLEAVYLAEGSLINLVEDSSRTGAEIFPEKFALSIKSANFLKLENPYVMYVTNEDINYVINSLSALNLKEHPALLLFSGNDYLAEFSSLNSIMI